MLRLPSFGRWSALLVSLAFGASAVAFAGTDLWIDGPQAVQPGTEPEFPDVAVFEDGLSIFVWNAFDASGGDRNDIFVRRFDAAGNPLDDPIFVNSYITDSQIYPRVAVSRNGHFLVIWQSSELDPGVGVNRYYVRSQLFDAQADPIGSEQLLSTLSSNIATDLHASVAALRDGGYVAVWMSQNSAGGDTNRSIQGRRVGAGGAPQGAQFQVNAGATGLQSDPDVAGLDDGGFVVVWATPEVQARRFAANGTPIGGDFQVNNLTAGVESDAEVVRGWDGRMLVLWRDDEGIGMNGEIRARLYDRELAPLGPDFRVNTLTAGTQETPRAGDYGPLGFFVAWESDGSVGNDGDGRSIQARIVTGVDQFAGAQEQLNTYITGTQQEPGVGGWFGRAATVWRSAGNAQQNSPVITALQATNCLFCDDLEWGTTQRWSSTTP